MFEINAGGAGSIVPRVHEADVVDGRGHETLRSRDSWREPSSNHNMRRQVHHELAYTAVEFFPMGDLLSSE